MTGARAAMNRVDLGMVAGQWRLASAGDERGLRFGRRVRDGMTHVNDLAISDQILSALAGERQSGLGCPRDCWVIARWVSLQDSRRQFPA